MVILVTSNQNSNSISINWIFDSNTLSINMNIKNIVLNLKKMDASRRSRFQSPAQRQFPSPSIVNRLFSPRNTRVNERFFSKKKEKSTAISKEGI